MNNIWKILIHLTDTCYWFATPFDNEAWIQKIIEIKKRSEWKMFSLLFSNLDQVKKYCLVDKKQEKFILENKFFSSFILKKIPGKNWKLKKFFPESDTVCVRIENEKFDYSPVKEDFFENWEKWFWWKPVTTTSVNISWEKFFYDKEKILKIFWKYEFIDFIFAKNLESEKFLRSSKIFDLTKFNWENFWQVR